MLLRLVTLGCKPVRALPGWLVNKFVPTNIIYRYKKWVKHGPPLICQKQDFLAFSKLQSGLFSFTLVYVNDQTPAEFLLHATGFESLTL